MTPATILAQLDHFSDGPTGALVPPLHLGVTSRPEGALTDVASSYGRSGNSAALLVESLMTTLEHGAVAAAFTSAAAIPQALLATLRPGDHVLFDSATYYEFARIFRAFGARWRVAVDQVDLTDLDAVRRALRPGQTRLIWSECPTNPLWRVPDIAALAALARAAGAKLLVDATVATPILCTPLRLGADLVLHSATKYLNGHGDLLAGVLVAAHDDDCWQAITEARTQHGSVLPPFEAWLLLRGMRTLALRMERCSASCLQVAEFLASHPAISAVHYPGLPANLSHPIAAKQFACGFGGMLSFQTGAAAADALAVCSKLRVFRRATSLGSTESLAEHRLTTEGPGSDCPPTLIRLSVGLEAAGDLIADLEQALSHVAIRM